MVDKVPQHTWETLLHYELTTFYTLASWFPFSSRHQTFFSREMEAKEKQVKSTTHHHHHYISIYDDDIFIRRSRVGESETTMKPFPFDRLIQWSTKRRKETRPLEIHFIF